MAKPTLQTVCDLSRALLGDDQISGGEIFTNTILSPFVLSALRELFRALRSAQDPFVLQEVFFNLPANTAVLDPATAGITDLAEPEAVEQRQINASVAVSNVVVGSGYATVTATGHGLSTGQMIVAYGIGGFDLFNNPNGLWAIQVVDANTLRLLGCTATGTYTSGGTISTGIGAFVPMDSRPLLNSADLLSTGSNPDAVYAWVGGVFQFVPSSVARQIKITYRRSGALPAGTNTIIPVEDCEDFLANRAASLAAAAKGSISTAERLKRDALGPTGEADGSGGLLRELVVADVRNLQRNVYRRGPFRPRRNREDAIY